jgi:hypothetical protein
LFSIILKRRFFALLDLGLTVTFLISKSYWRLNVVEFIIQHLCEPVVGSYASFNTGTRCDRPHNIQLFFIG